MCQDYKTVISKGLSDNVHFAVWPTSFPELQRKTFDENSVFSPCNFQVHHIQCSLPRKAVKQRSVTGTAWFQFIPILRHKRRGGSSAQRQVKKTIKKKLWIAPAALWSKDEERRPRLKAKRWRKDKGLPVPWRYDLRVVPVCGTHLHVNTGSRRWKWAPALRRSWTCWATGGRRRNAGGWAPSCWTNPTLSYVPSPRPRCSFCHQKKHFALLTSETCGGSIRAAGRFRIRRQRILT